MKIPEIIKVQSQHRPGSLAKVLAVIGQHGVVVEGLKAVNRDFEFSTWEITIETDDSHGVEAPSWTALTRWITPACWGVRIACLPGT